MQLGRDRWHAPAVVAVLLLHLLLQQFVPLPPGRIAAAAIPAAGRAGAPPTAAILALL
jgi:hypothetical protein